MRILKMNINFAETYLLRTTMITDNDVVGYARVSRISQPTANHGFDNRAQKSIVPHPRQVLCSRPPETTGFAPYCLRHGRLN